jgi:hypothetical protein
MRRSGRVHPGGTMRTHKLKPRRSSAAAAPAGGHGVMAHQPHPWVPGAESELWTRGMHAFHAALHLSPRLDELNPNGGLGTLLASPRWVACHYFLLLGELADYMARLSRSTGLASDWVMAHCKIQQLDGRTNKWQSTDSWSAQNIQDASSTWRFFS